MSEVKDAPAPSSVLKPSMLRPSKFASSTAENTIGENSENLEKEKSNQNVNPFLKEYQLQDENDSQNNSAATSEKDKNNTENTVTDPLKLLSKPNFSKIKIFTNANSMQNQDSGFVFGQNLHERVVGENIKAHEENSTSEEQKNSNDSSLLFTNAMQNSSNNENGKEKPAETKSLTQIAREYEESRAQKRTYEEVKTFTGEENENNVVEIDCKLFAFENGNYEERSRGILRLNDSREKDNVHRVVFRTFGTLRLLVNTKVWSDMIVESPSPKSLRFTAMDNNGQIKIYLAMSRPDYVSTFFTALKSRVTKLKSMKPESTESASSNPLSEEKSNESNDKLDTSENKLIRNEIKEHLDKKVDILEKDSNSSEDNDDNDHGEDDDEFSEPRNKKLNVQQKDKKI